MEFPDEVRLMPEAERNRQVLALGKSFMHVHPQGFFVRALLPVRLSDGHEFHFGVLRGDIQGALDVMGEPGIFDDAF